MINFLHTNIPEPILISFGFVNIYYYGLFIVIGMLMGLFIATKLANRYGISKNLVVDSAFYLIIGCIASARLYHVLLELPYYLRNPLNIFKVWEGGLAIHGAILAGIAITYYISKVNKVDFWKFSSIFVPGLALAQALGRWGNYFNQELFGKPSDLAWAIPISAVNRVSPYFYSEYYHPTFLYESIGNLLIFLVLISMHLGIIKSKKFQFKTVVLTYLALYSVLRFSLEFVRIDPTPVILGLKTPQLASVIIVALIGVYLYKSKKGARGLK